MRNRRVRLALSLAIPVTRRHAARERAERVAGTHRIQPSRSRRSPARSTRSCSPASGTGASDPRAADASRPSPACRRSRSRSTWARPAAACGRPTDAGQSWVNVTDGQIGVGSMGAIDVSQSDPNTDLHRHRLRRPPLERLDRRRRLQVHRRRQDVDARRAARRRQHRRRSRPSDEPGHRVRRGDRQPLQA